MTLRFGRSKRSEKRSAHVHGSASWRRGVGKIADEVSGRTLEKSKCVIDLANLLNGPTTMAKQQTVNLLTYGVILKYENA